MLLALLLISPLAARGRVAPPPWPAAAPISWECFFYPSPASNTSFVCGDDNTDVPAFLNATMRFSVNVSDDLANNVTVTWYFDYYNPNSTGGFLPEVNPDSPRKSVNVTVPGADEVVYVETNWTYDRPGNFTQIANQSWKFWVFVETRDADNESDPFPWLFPVIVNRNVAPSVDGLSGTYGVEPPLRFPNPVVPLFYLNVTILDGDNDTVAVTWEWGDGTFQVDSVELVDGRKDVGVTHQYPIAQFPLNETARTVTFVLLVWTDDGIPGHNESVASNVEFSQDYDFPPRPRIDAPTVGSVWKVGEEIPMRGNATDSEGDAVDYYWDFDNRTDSDGNGDPTTDRDALGNETSHAYPAAGIYNLTLWATDGIDKKLCYDPLCSAYEDHWVKAMTILDVRPNTRPSVVVELLYTGLADEPLLLRAVVLDSDGDDMTTTWDFGDGSPAATNVTDGTRGVPQAFELFQEHTYRNVTLLDENGVPEYLTLRVTVGDGNLTNETTTLVFIGSQNFAPQVSSFAVRNETGNYTNERTLETRDAFALEVNVTDFEGDNLTVRIAWGDGTFNVTTVQAVDGNYSLPLFYHNYSSPGTFQINITLDDGKVFLVLNETGVPDLRSHNVTRAGPEMNVRSRGRVVELGPWDWWDTLTLAVALAIPLALIGRAVYVIRKEREEAD